MHCSAYDHKERSLGDVWWLLLPVKVLQDCGEPQNFTHFAAVAVCSIVDVGFFWRTAQASWCLMWAHHSSLLAAGISPNHLSPQQPTQRACMSYRQQLISGSAVTFPCSYGCQLLCTYLQLERTCIFCFSLSRGEYKMQSASTEQKRMCLLVWWKSGQLCYGPRHWHSSVGTEPGLLGLIFIKQFLMIYIPSLGINLNDRERFGPLH